MTWRLAEAMQAIDQALDKNKECTVYPFSGMNGGDCLRSGSKLLVKTLLSTLALWVT